MLRLWPSKLLQVEQIPHLPGSNHKLYKIFGMLLVMQMVPPEISIMQYGGSSLKVHT